MPNQPEPNLPTDEPSVAPSTLELLLAEIDAACRLVGLELDRLEKLVAQLHPERARAAQTAVILARTGIDEIRDRAHSKPLDEGGNLSDT